VKHNLYSEIVSTLLAAGVDTKIRDHNGNTALQVLNSRNGIEKIEESDVYWELVTKTN
tara:strand:+ start:14551 stop:14724 length:174 start_codon:yes stop_codon:yes gene_type:complete